MHGWKAIIHIVPLITTLCTFAVAYCVGQRHYITGQYIKSRDNQSSMPEMLCRNQARNISNIARLDTQCTWIERKMRTLQRRDHIWVPRRRQLYSFHPLLPNFHQSYWQAYLTYIYISALHKFEKVTHINLSTSQIQFWYTKTPMRNIIDKMTPASLHCCDSCLCRYFQPIMF